MIGEVNAMSKYDFEALTAEEFRVFLQGLQKSPYNWPNLYFAWKKPDDSLFMVGVASTQSYHLMVYEIDMEWRVNQMRVAHGSPAEYAAKLYGIAPGVGTDCSQQSVLRDPVACLVSKVSEFRFLGFWEDPDILIYEPRTRQRVVACGRFALAKEKIFAAQMSIDAVLVNAKYRADSEASSRLEDCSAKKGFMDLSD